MVFVGFKGLSRLRARSTPRNDSTIFIPQPDYLRFDPISINTTHQDDSLRYFGRSQPDIHRLDSEEQNYKVIKLIEILSDRYSHKL